MPSMQARRGGLAAARRLGPFNPLETQSCQIFGVRDEKARCIGDRHVILAAWDWDRGKLARTLTLPCHRRSAVET